MRFLRVLAVLALAILVGARASAGQRGQHVPSPAHPSGQPPKPAAHHTVIPVAQRIDANPALVARLQPLVPAGMTLDNAAQGFRSVGQFAAALHASKDLNIPFAQLKTEMTGTDHDRLGQAIHDLQPNVDAKAAAKTAEQEARADIKATRPTPPTVTQRIDANSALVARLQPLVPSGLTLDSAAQGFGNVGQFVAALHASKNLNIPFAQLKAEMTGTDHDSLGQAIHQLQPNVDAKATAKTAEEEARADLKATRPAGATNGDRDDDIR